jgi:hypothetical protein
MSDDSVRGRFVWHELMTTDPRVAKDFYSRVVGWKPQAFSQDPSYTVLTTKDGMMAGLMMLPAEAASMGAPPSWLVYVGVANVDDTVSQAEDMGAKTLKAPTNIPNVGRFAVLQDPQGAVFSVFTPAAGSGETRDEQRRTPLGDFSWHELITTDWSSGFAFYQKLFGWEKTESMDMGPGLGVYQMFGWGGKTVGGMFNKPKEMPAPPHWLPYALVPDVHEAAGLVTRLGGRVVNGPMEVPGGDWIVQFLDPQGALFALHSAKKPETASAEGGAARGAETRPARPQGEKAAPRRRTAGTAARTPGMKPARKSAEKPAVAAKKPVAKKPAAKKPAKAAKKVAKKSGKKVSKKAAKKPAMRKTAKVAKKPAMRKTATKKTAKAGRKTARPARKAARPARKTGRKAAARPARKATRKTARKTAGKAARKTARKSARTGARKGAARKRGRR